MRLNGERLTTASEVIIPIIRSNEKDNLYFIARAVEDPSEFHRLLKVPAPSTVEEPGKDPVPTESAVMKNMLLNSYDYYIDYHIVMSLIKIGKIEVVTETDPETKAETTKQIKVFHPVEWETIDLEDIKTYSKWKSELIEAGLNSGECTRLHNAVLEANSLTESGVDKARDDFLALPEADQ